VAFCGWAAARVLALACRQLNIQGDSGQHHPLLHQHQQQAAPKEATYDEQKTHKESVSSAQLVAFL
jgi:hypothetical protein